LDTVPPARQDSPPSAHPALGHVERLDGARAYLRLEDGCGDADSFRSGRMIKVLSAGRMVLGVIRGLERDARGLAATAEFLGAAGPDGGLQRGIAALPMPGDPVQAITDQELSELFSPGVGDYIALGRLSGSSVPATVQTDRLLARHFAVLGSTGTGKSSAVALTLRRLVETLPSAHILVIDPHNEYATAFSDIGVHFDPTTLSLPYWLMNLEEHVEIFLGGGDMQADYGRDILKRALLGARQRNSRFSGMPVTVDSPIPYKMSDLLAELDDQAGKLEKRDDSQTILRILQKVEELKSDKRYAFMFSGMLINDTLPDTLGRLLRMPPGGRPVATLDLSGVPSDIMDVVVALLSRLTFDFAVWSGRDDAARPFLLVCEEAHRYVPRRTGAARGAAGRMLERIAKEGRKYGVALGLVSQRPSDLSESVLSQCGTVFAMRMNNDRDLAFVRDALPEGGKGYIDSLSALANGECLISGEGVPVPLRVTLDRAEEEQRPDSGDPAFAEKWRLGGDENPAFVTSVIDRWRHGRRA